MGTGAHAALLAPEDVRLWRHAGSSTSRRREALSLELPEYDPASTVVLFPESKVGDELLFCICPAALRYAAAMLC